MSRSRILRRIQEATDSSAVEAAKLAQRYEEISRSYDRIGSLSTNAKISLLIDRFQSYDVVVRECNPSTLTVLIREQLATSGRRTFVAPPVVPAQWMIAGFEWRVDADLGHYEVEQIDGVVTPVYCAIADSRTIVLHHSANESGRVLTPLPDWKLCIVFASQVVETLPEYFARFELMPALATWISGPGRGT